MTDKHAQWLALGREDPIDPGPAIIDPHHHLWDYPEHRYLAGELLEDIAGGHRVVKTVFVECLSMYRRQGPQHLRPVGETDFVAGISGLYTPETGTPVDVAAGIVGFADLCLGEKAAETLEAHVEAGRGRFRGIRHASAWDESPEIRNAHTHPPRGLLSDPAFRRGFACLQKYDLSFDAWLYHRQLPELADLAAGFPSTAIILDHVGSPLGIGPYAGRRQEVFEGWKQGIRKVAACDNVFVKLGGMAMTLCGFGWHRRPQPPSSAELAEAMAPWFLFCIEAFGPGRCMFESNFPVDKVSCPYTVVWNAFARIAAGLSMDEKKALFHDTAARVYRL